MVDLAKLVDRFRSSEILLKGELSGQAGVISCDSREIETAGAEVLKVFFARRGFSFDGHDFVKKLDQSTKNVVFVIEEASLMGELQQPAIQVRSTQQAMAIAAKLFYQDPSAELFCAAVTGTNGKTTSSFLIQALLEAAGKPTAVSGSVTSQFRDRLWDASLTTPDFPQLQQRFLDFKRAGAQAVAFEASSHALDQKRLMGLELDAALFTNLTHDHLDYHKTMENYFNSKKRLFTELLVGSSKQKKVAILPEDNPYGTQLIHELGVQPEIKIYTWSRHGKVSANKILIENEKRSLEGTEFDLHYGLQKAHLKLNLVGSFNVDNFAGVAALALAQGFELSVLEKMLKSPLGVPGRLEKVSDQPAVFIDFAHTPDALENVFSSLRPLVNGKLKCVFGCGGDRDKDKRPKMGEIVELYCDEFIITSDNPRTEDPRLIIENILAGVQKTKIFEIEVDRKTAIEKALASLGPGDCLVVAGKGHEKYQIIGDEKKDFDDVQVVKDWMASS